MREGVAVLGPDVPTRSSTGPAGGATLLDLRPLERPDLQRPDLQRPDLQRPDLQRPDLQRPDLQRPDLQRPDLQRPDLQRPDLQRPDLQRPDLQRPDLQRPDLQRPDPVPDQRQPPPSAPDAAGVVVCVGLDPEQAVAVLRLLGRDTSVVLAPDAAHAVRLLGRGEAAPPAPAPPTSRQVHRVGDLEIDPDARQVTCRDRPVPVSAREFDLLFVLAGQPGRVHGFGELTERVWSRDYLGDDDSVASAVKRLRRRLAGATQTVRVESVRGIGYRLVVGDGRD